MDDFYQLKAKYESINCVDIWSKYNEQYNSLRSGYYINEIELIKRSLNRASSPHFKSGISWTLDETYTFVDRWNQIVNEIEIIYEFLHPFFPDIFSPSHFKISYIRLSE